MKKGNAKKAVCAALLLAALAAAGAALFAVSAGLRPGEARDLLASLRRHDSFNYVSHGTLSDAWLSRARAAHDEAVYIVLSNTKSAASKLIGRWTGDPYNHVSLAFDDALDTLVSFNGGGAGGTPGMNPESAEDLRRVEGASFAVYRLGVSAAQKRAMLERIEAVNREGSSYNLLGLLTGISAKPNIQFCSQFVYATLAAVGAAPFAPPRGTIKPMDFVRFSAKNALALVSVEKNHIFLAKTLDRHSNLSDN